MATTRSNFVEVTGSTAVLSGSAVTTPPFLVAMGPKEAMSVSQVDQVAGGSGAATASAAVVVDRVTVDLSYAAIPVVGSPHQVPETYGTVLGAFAKNGCQLMTLSGTTAESLNLTDLTANSPTSYAGDTTFATANCLIFNNLGTHDLTVAPGASNPAGLPKFTGTTPTLTIPAGSIVVVHSAAGVTVDSTHNILTITPTAGGSLAISVGGA